ncbi:hypothetical protein OUZ56_003173 [Daphnia magna]|uniref:Uncharacterized protein n=1 Tax=Daphnia magna TaxID=35525 RepID=A0ABR0A878_9CRUS|nr:hypothetical protein OUZ56_003173 [Daphnia magna]
MQSVRAVQCSCWLANSHLCSDVGREPPAPSVINRVIFVLRFDDEDSNYVYVTFLRLCDLFPNIPLQLVDVLRVDAMTTQVRGLFNSGNVTPLSSICVPEDLANPIVHEGVVASNVHDDVENILAPSATPGSPDGRTSNGSVDPILRG